MEDFKSEVTAVTIDKENGSKVTIRFIFQNARTSSTFGIERDPDNQLIKIISKDIRKEVKPTDWIYAQICIKDKSFKPYIYYPKGELKMDSYVKMNIGTAHHATAYVASDEDSTEVTGRLYSPFYTRGLLLDDIADLRNFGLSTHHLILDFMKFPFSDYNNLRNSIASERIEASYARFNGTSYHFASGEYNRYYPDVKLDQDSLLVAPNKNAIIATGVRTIGIPSGFPTFRMTVNMRVNVKKYYNRSVQREYDTEIPPFYTWFDKQDNVLLRCWPEFAVIKAKDKTSWTYGKTQGVRCDFRGGINGPKTFKFQTGKDGVYFLNLVIYSDDGRTIRLGHAGSELLKVKLPDGSQIYPRDTDKHVWGGIRKNHLQEPTPFGYDYELINIHTGYAGEKAVLDIKKGFEKYSKFTGKPIAALGDNGIDAVNCKDPKSASFWNGKNLACLRWASNEDDRDMSLTKEKNKLTAKFFKDFSCNRHAVLKIDGKCAPCPKKCDVCNQFKTCDFCLPGYQLNEEKSGCEKCEDYELYDTITKQCVRRLKDSNNLQFDKFHNRVSSSSVFLGPDEHGEVMVVQGAVTLKNRSGSQHKMFEDKDDPIYPDDNVEILVSINDVDQEVYTLTMRTDENVTREFFITVPVPKLSELKIKFRLSNFANTEDYD